MANTINIGTSKGNIVGAQINKPFKDIEFSDIQQIVKEKFGSIKGIKINGWCLIDKKPKQEKQC